MKGAFIVQRHCAASTGFFGVLPLKIALPNFAIATIDLHQSR
jgi:hypothetical protein